MLHFFGCWGFRSHASSSGHVTKQRDYQQQAISRDIYIQTVTNSLLL
jgi:hypothetical protein